MTLFNTLIKNTFITRLIGAVYAIISKQKDSMNLYNYKITEIKKVVDGDTIDVVIDLGFDIRKKTRVRLLDIDAPETRTKDLDEKAKGLKSKDFLSAILDGCKSETEIILKSTKLDSFGRSLGYIYIDKENLSEIMIKNGYANAR